ncbi:UDP-glucose/GDP-mannose dehydrogenase family protein [Candidatus Sumerlaeota bacterium]|nr:UDP-glucose/GDP-mannose dehydrogenase family protein [Candidatus Sumerlaeota bacterium]
MNVCVIGVGYVGLVTGAVFADLGNEVICVDKVEEKINMLKRGEMPIYEPGLEELVARNVKEGRLSFTTNIGEGVRRSEVIFIAVGTPPRENGETDLSHVEAVALEIAHHLNHYKIIVNKSTVPVGTGDLVRNIIEKNKNNDVEFDVVSNPEFLREGSAIADTLKPDRIVIGAPTQNVAMTLLELYAPIERPMLITNVESAEMIKYASNAFLSTKISFINMIADLCEKTGADVTMVAKGMGYDQRIGMHFLQAGLGFGGSCFPKDTLSLIHTARKYGEEFRLLEEVIKINQQRVPRFVERIAQRLNPLNNKTIAVLGLAFKPDTDDLRDAKSVELITLLRERGATIKAYDPVAINNARKILPDIIYCKNSYDAAEGADALVIVTEWNEFKLLNLERLKSVMQQPIIFDGRNIYDPKRIRKMGFEYYSIGRK